MQNRSQRAKSGCRHDRMRSERRTASQQILERARGPTARRRSPMVRPTQESTRARTPPIAGSCQDFGAEERRRTLQHRRSSVGSRRRSTRAPLSASAPSAASNMPAPGCPSDSPSSNSTSQPVSGRMERKEASEFASISSRTALSDQRQKIVARSPAQRHHEMAMHVEFPAEPQRQRAIRCAPGRHSESAVANAPPCRRLQLGGLGRP